jgi:hypothetical protein
MEGMGREASPLFGRSVGEDIPNKLHEHTRTDTTEMLQAALGMLELADDILLDSHDISKEIIFELKALISHYDKPTKDKMLAVLDTPHDLIPFDLCPNLLTQLQLQSEHSYSSQMQRSVYNKVGRDNDKVRLKRETYAKKSELRDIIEVSLRCRRRDVHCVPPITLMKSIENLAVNEGKRAWGRSTRDLYTVGRRYTEEAVLSVSSWKPQPTFVSHGANISADFGLGVYDNLEFKLSIPEARVKDGVMLQTSILHTTTCEYHIFKPNPM